MRLFVDKYGKTTKTAGKIDYVAGWYYKAAQLVKRSKDTRAALVSTNSITQGEQVAAIWKPLKELFGIHIDFACRTFRWDSEASLKAHVHCVIVGFSTSNNPKKVIYDGERVINANNINGYLIDATDVFIEARTTPICDVPQMLNGGKPTEGGFLILTEEEKDELLQANPKAANMIRPYMMGKDFIERKPRYCLWLVSTSPSDLRQCPKVMERITKVREYRLASPKAATQKKAETPMLFDEVRECVSDYVAIPKVSSENRRYIPMDFLPKEIIPGDKLFMLPAASLYSFGIMTSNVHMAWMRATCGRLKSDYSYSNTIVYNNFPWPSPTNEQKAKIEQTAQAILDTRAMYPTCTLADLYNEALMPPALRKAHQDNDRAVMQAYGFPIKRDLQESYYVAELFKMYQELMKEK